MELLPAELSTLSLTGLVLLSFFSSAVTASLGTGGGLLMLTVMISFLPPTILLPVHGVIQMGSSGSQVAVMSRDIDWKLWGFFSIGSVLGGNPSWANTRQCLPRNVTGGFRALCDLCGVDP